MHKTSHAIEKKNSADNIVCFHFGIVRGESSTTHIYHRFVREVIELNNIFKCLRCAKRNFEQFFSCFVLRIKSNRKTNENKKKTGKFLSA